MMEVFCKKRRHSFRWGGEWYDLHFILEDNDEISCNISDTLLKQNLCDIKLLAPVY